VQQRMTAALPELLADLEALVSCETPSADQGAVAAGARLLAELGTERLGAAPELLTVDGCPHLRWRLGPAPAQILVLGHLDTVWPLGSLQDHPYRIEGNVLRGPGCLDMKAGLAMALQALGSLPDTAGVTLLVTGDEELGSPSSRQLIEAEAAGCRAALVLEAAAGSALKVARKGVSLYELRVHGRAAHAGLEPERGINAGLELAHQLPALTELADPAAGTTVTPTRLSAGTTTNTVPAQGKVAVDVRVRTLAEQHRVDEAMHRLSPVLAGAELSVQGGPNRPPLEPALSRELFARAERVARRLGLPAPVGVAVGGASDGNFTAGIGTPTLDGLGASGGGAHASDEHVLIDELPARTALLAGLIADLLAEAAPVPAPAGSRAAAS